MAFSNPIVGDEVLIRNAIQSSDYSAGVAGWRIAADGSAEFSGATFRGTIAGNGYILNTAGVFLYQGTPAANNIVGSWTSSAGTDEFGNVYPAGLTLYDGVSNTITNFFGGPDNLVYNISGSEWVGFFLGNLLLAAGDPNGPRVLSDSGAISIIGDNSAITISSPVNATLADHSVLWMSAGNSASNTGDVDYAHARLDFSDFWLSGTMRKTFVPAGQSTPTPVTAHAPIMGTGWATGPGGGGAYPPLQYLLDAEDNIHVFGTFHTTSTTPNGIVATGFPVTNQTNLGGVGVLGSATRFQGAVGALGLYINNVGELRSSNTLTYVANDSFMINAKVPVGNLW